MSITSRIAASSMADIDMFEAIPVSPPRSPPLHELDYHKDAAVLFGAPRSSASSPAAKRKRNNTPVDVPALMLVQEPSPIPSAFGNPQTTTATTTTTVTDDGETVVVVAAAAAHTGTNGKKKSKMSLLSGFSLASLSPMSATPAQRRVGASSTSTTISFTPPTSPRYRAGSEVRRNSCPGGADGEVLPPSNNHVRRSSHSPQSPRTPSPPTSQHNAHYQYHLAPPVREGSPFASPFASPKLERLRGILTGSSSLKKAKNNNTITTTLTPSSCTSSHCTTKGSVWGGMRSRRVHVDDEDDAEGADEDGATKYGSGLAVSMLSSSTSSTSASIDCCAPRFAQVSLRKVDYFGLLPDEILVHLLTFLTPRDVVNAIAFLDPRFWRLSQDDSIWKLKFAEKWDHVPSPKMRARGWKHAYMLQVKADKDWLNPKRKPTMKDFSGHTNIIRCVDFDDTRIVSGGEDESIIVWNRESGQREHTIKAHKQFVHCVLMSPSVLISGGGDNIINLYDPKDDFKVKSSIKAHNKGVRCLQLAGNDLFSGSYDHTIKLWDVETQQLQREFTRKDEQSQSLTAHRKTVFGMQYRPADRLLISTGADRCIRAFDPRTGNEIWAIACKHLHTDWMMAICFDETKIVAASRDKTISVWDMHTRKFSHTLQGHKLGVVDLQMDEQKLVSGSGDNTARVWNMSKRYCVRSIEHGDTVWCVRFKEDTLVTGGGKADPHVRMFSFTDH
eukprot:TRINITY_DN3000_c0_g2_i1.p1 TRINITY_DN3000_c0_g2~~TRINITY_DN3000_c0_g2_i1.p1  ORF type:complete len:728 (-),score=163.91 TRINITY_DN3000_c0_g2_i1:1416-3599(-)